MLVTDIPSVLHELRVFGPSYVAEVHTAEELAEVANALMQSPDWLHIDDQAVVLGPPFGELISDAEKISGQSILLAFEDNGVVVLQFDNGDFMCLCAVSDCCCSCDEDAEVSVVQDKKYLSLKAQLKLGLITQEQIDADNKRREEELKQHRYQEYLKLKSEFELVNEGPVP